MIAAIHFNATVAMPSISMAPQPPGQAEVSFDDVVKEQVPVASKIPAREEAQKRKEETKASESSAQETVPASVTVMPPLSGRWELDADRSAQPDSTEPSEATSITKAVFFVNPADDMLPAQSARIGDSGAARDDDSSNPSAARDGGAVAPQNADVVSAMGAAAADLPLVTAAFASVAFPARGDRRVAEPAAAKPVAAAKSADISSVAQAAVVAQSGKTSSLQGLLQSANGALNAQIAVGPVNMPVGEAGATKKEAARVSSATKTPTVGGAIDGDATTDANGVNHDTTTTTDSAIPAQAAHAMATPISVAIAPDSDMRSNAVVPSDAAAGTIAGQQNRADVERMSALSTGDAQTIASADVPAGTLMLSESRLTQAIQRTDMTIGMHSDEFGAISIRTLATRDQISAVISVDHADLGHALESHVLSAPVTTREDRPLDVKVQYMGSPAEGFSRNADSQNSQGDERKGRYAAPTAQAGASVAGLRAVGSIDAVAMSSGRLDVRG